MTEKIISGKITRALKKAGYLVNALPKPPGWADITAVGYQKVYFLEVKKPNTFLSPLQQLTKSRFEILGQNYFRVTSVEDLKEIGII